MNKPFLLISGYNYYPKAGTENWVGFFSSEEEIESNITPIIQHELYSSGKNKGQIRSTSTMYRITLDNYDRTVDWYEIVDIRDYVY